MQDPEERLQDKAAPSESVEEAMRASPEPSSPEDCQGVSSLESSCRPDAAGAQKPWYYVGMGASAGGLEALESFFSNMQPDSGLAFIVIQHLSPQYKSLMVELLSKHTRMKVCRAEDNQLVQPDHVYLIPPKKNLTIFHGRLLLKEQDHSQGINLPIDVFLRSLAEDQGEKSVGIILSGTGSDGMRGVRAIKEAGGMVMVQDEDSAKFDGMPRSAISTGLADFILPPDQMPVQLCRFSRQPYASRSEPSGELMTDEDNMTRIFALLRERSGVDFTFYKPSTVVRRIQRRMTINQAGRLKDYVKFLETSPREVENLHRELLIGVTSFFRDPEGFDALAEKALPSVFENAHNSEMRFWIAGCSTGEEAYSLAILCQEHMEKVGKRWDVKIFATDIDRESVERAGSGIYPESIAADLPDERLSRYFVKKGDAYHVARVIREMVVFAPHNLLKDPPFARIDLLSCRNLLIYLQPVLQRRVLSLFQFSLRPEGILFLGTSETVGDLSDQYETVDGKWKIFRASGGGRLSLVQALESPMRRHHGPPEQPVRSRGPVQATEDDRLLDRLLTTIADQYVPAGVVVNERMEVVHVIGDVSNYFRMQPGRLTNDITKMADRDLAIPLATSIQKVLKGQNEVLYRNIRLSGSRETLDLRTRRLPEKKNQEHLIAVFLEKDTESATPRPASGNGEGDTETFDIGEEAQQRITDLEQELQYTKENLQATIEELETSNEELQATNEELLASNEELQSTNEELQSVNEELYTVNAEYQAKIQELTDLNNDIDNLLRSTRIGTLFLDEELTIRKFTPAIHSVVKLIEQDVGRPVRHLSTEMPGVNLVCIAEQIRDTHATIEREVETRDGEWFLLRALPYETDDHHYEGVVITFISITALKTAQDELCCERNLLDRITQTTRSGILIINREGRITFANKQAMELLSVREMDLLGKPHDGPEWCVTDGKGDAVAPRDRPFERVVRNKQPVLGVHLCIARGDGPPACFEVNSSPMFNEDGEVSTVVQTIFRIDRRS